jgi:hypothetical protein
MMVSLGRVVPMTSKSLLILRRASVAVACAAVVGLASAPAQARIFVGIGIPFYGPGYYPAPYYYPPPPPVYYAPPPPVYYAPPPPEIYTPPQRNYSQIPAAASANGGQACYAGSYVCPMDRPVVAGGNCYCLGNGGQKVWGKTN